MSCVISAAMLVAKECTAGRSARSSSRVEVLADGCCAIVVRGFLVLMSLSEESRTVNMAVIWG